MGKLYDMINENLDIINEDISIYENFQMLTEKLLTFGNKVYPKFGNVVIMAGGAGSGKGFIKDKMLGIEGKVFDVDELKSLSLRSKKINSEVKKCFGVDLSELNLKNPDDVFILHEIIGDELNIPNKQKKALFTSVLASSTDRKPNLIFDVTLKDLKKLKSIVESVKRVGYNKENVHIVWVINDIEMARKQNRDRSRTVPDEILLNTHTGVSITMKDIIDMSHETLSNYMDGDIWFVFNKKGVDSEVSFSGKGGMYIKDMKYFKIKEKGKPTDKTKLNKEIQDKIIAYTPNKKGWDE